MGKKLDLCCTFILFPTVEIEVVNMSAGAGHAIGGISSSGSNDGPNGQAANGGFDQDRSSNRLGSTEDEYVFSEEERNAMRGFLQRGEVRLSTIHRVAVGFLSGAGLLFLFPVFLKDGVLALITALLDYTPTFPTSMQSFGMVGVVVVYLCLLFPFLLSLGLPVAALLLLLEDIVRFYFVGHPPTFPEEFFNPRFVLTGIAFSPDESPEVKSRVLRHEYGTDLIGFVVSRVDAHSGYYSRIIDKPDRHIVPTTRKLPRLLRSGIVKSKGEKPLEQLVEADRMSVQGSYHNGNGEDIPFAERTVDEIDRFNAALGLAGFIERPLYEEVAKTEVSLVRHSLKLRRLVLRYFQALLILIWTSFVTFLMLPFLNDASGRFSIPLVFSISYLLWASLAPWIVQLPLVWLVSHPHNDVRRDALNRFEKLDALQTFGRTAKRLCYVAIGVSLLAIALELIFRV